MSLVVGIGAFGGGVWLLVESVEGLINSLRAWAAEHEGRIVGTGKHDELLRGNALYARVAALQFGAGDSAREERSWPT